MKYGKQGLWQKIISSPITVVVFVLFFVFLARSVWIMKERLGGSRDRLETAKVELEKLEDHRSALANKINYLSTDQGIEAELRTKYRAVREGESVAVIVENDQTANVANFASTSADNVEKQDTWFRKMLQFIGL